MTPEEKAFRRDIIEHPEDDALRLIFADWLEDQGDPYADLIRVQCQLAKIDEFDDSYFDLKIQENNVLQQLKRANHELISRKRSTGNPSFVNRGFIQSIFLDENSDLQLVNEEYQWEPITKIDFFSLPDEYQSFFSSWSFLRRVRSLSIDGRFEGFTLNSLLGSPHLSNLKSLSISCKSFDISVAEIIGQELSSNKLTELEIDRTGFQALFHSSQLENLTTFKLVGGGSAEEDTLSILAQECPWKHLRSLTLNLASFSNDGVESFREAAWTHQLEELHVIDMESHVSITPFLLSPYMENLSKLTITETEINDTGTFVIPTALTSCQLSELNLGDTRLNALSLQPLVESDLFDHLKVLRLELNELGTEGCALLGAGKFPQLQYLDLHGNEITAQGMKALNQHAEFPSLRRLDLASNPIGEEGLKSLCASDYASTLYDLGLGSTRIDTITCMRALTQPGCLSQLRCLTLEGNLLSTQAAIVLCNSELAHQLSFLDFEIADINSEYIRTLLALADSKRLISLHVSCKKLSHKIDKSVINELHDAFGDRLCLSVASS